MYKTVFFLLSLMIFVVYTNATYADPERPSSRPSENRSATAKDKAIQDTKRQLAQLKYEISANKARQDAARSKSAITEETAKKIARLKMTRKAVR